MVENVGALVLAAATGSGFGGAVAMGRWQQGTILDHIVTVAVDAGISDVTVVLGPFADEVMESARDQDVTFVIDSDWAEGASSGLRAGLDTMLRSPQLETAVIFDVGLPGVDPRIVVQLLGAHNPELRPVTLPKYRYARSGPVVIDRILWPRLMGLEGPVDLVTLLDAHPGWANELWIDLVPPVHVETPDDVDGALGSR